MFFFQILFHYLWFRTSSPSAYYVCWLLMTDYFLIKLYNFFIISSTVVGCFFFLCISNAAGVLHIYFCQAYQLASSEET